MSKIYDGVFTAPIQDGAKRIIYPLGPEGNYTAQLIERLYVVAATAYAFEPVNRYAPTTGQTVPTCDPENSQAFLVEEVADESLNPLGMTRFRRTYATVPSASTLPSTIVVPRPNIPGDGAFPRMYSTYLADKPDDTVESFDIYDLADVTADSGVPAFYPTGGSYTLSFAGYTTSTIAYNATAGDVAVAVNALASVVSRGSVAASGTYNSAGGISMTFSAYSAATVNSALDSSGLAVTSVVNAFYQGRNQTFSMSVQSIKANPSPVTVVTASVVPTAYSSGFYYGSLQYDLCQVQINTLTAMSGSFTLTIGGQTATIPVTATQGEAVDLMNALNVGLFTVGGPSSGYPLLGGYYGDPQPLQVNFFFYYYAVIRGGTYSVSIFSQTTGSIAYNAVAATISAAINALTDVVDRGGCTVTGDGLAENKLSIGFAVNFTEPALVGTSSLTPTSNITVETATNGTFQTVKTGTTSAVRTLVAAGHNAVNGGMLAINAAATYRRQISDFTVIDANTVQLGIQPGYSYATAATITQVGGRTKTAYTPGSKRVRCTKNTAFYLPGFTSGITVAGDIPLAEDESSDAEMLAAIFSNQGSINFSVGDLEPYRFPILKQSVITVNSADL
jgi:hypothetical protein